MKILISEAQYNRILIENSFELTEGGRGHYEDRKKRIQETLDVVFEYGGPKNLIQTFGDSIPKLWNPDTTTLEKFVKPSSKMALGDSYVVGKFKVGDDEYKSILDRLEFLEKNFKKFLNHKSEDKFIIRIYEYNLNPSTTKGQQSNFDRIEFSNENVKEFLPTFFKKSDTVNLFIANKPKEDDKDGPSVGDSIIVLLQFDDLDTIINDRSRDQLTKFTDFKIMGFSEFKKEVEKINKEEEKSIIISPQFRSDSLEPKVRERAKVAPRTIEGFFKLLPGELESEVKDVYNILSKARESHREIIARYKELGKFGSDDMKSEIAGLGISMYKEKIKSIMSNNISSKFMESFVELFDPKPLVREGFVYVNTDFGMLKLTEGQLESISYLL